MYLFCSHRRLVSSIDCLTKSSLKGLRFSLFLPASFTRFKAASPNIFSLNTYITMNYCRLLNIKEIKIIWKNLLLNKIFNSMNSLSTSILKIKQELWINVGIRQCTNNTTQPVTLTSQLTHLHYLEIWNNVMTINL